jgi:hypothetical protein
LANIAVTIFRVHVYKERLESRFINEITLGGLVVACYPLDPRFAGSNPAEDDGFLRVIKIRSMTSFGGEVKPSVPCRRFTACKRTLRA